MQLSCRDDIDALRQLHEQKEELKGKLAEEREISTTRLQEAVNQVRADTIAKLRKEYEEEMEKKLGDERKVHQIAVSLHLVIYHFVLYFVADCKSSGVAQWVG